jgi:hypothetical protein
MPQPAWVAGRLQKESAVSRFFYNTILKRSSTYMTAVMIMATATGAHARAGVERLLLPRHRCRGRAERHLSSLRASLTRSAAALRAGIGYDYAMNAIWDFKNKGVRTRRRLHFARPTLRCAALGRASPLPPPLPFTEALEGHQNELQGGVERVGCYWGLTVAALVADVALRELEV